MNPQIIMIAAIAAISTVGSAIYQGILTDRWNRGSSAELVEYTKRLDSFPETIGNWTKLSDMPVDPEEFKRSGCTNYVSRTYENKSTGQVVNLFLVSGKGYHITIHTPDWCYVAAGYDMPSDPRNYSFEVRGLEANPDCLNATFIKEESTSTNRLRILWSYSDDGNWVAPANAKVQFGTQPAMYKVYLISELDGSVTDLEQDATVAFAKEFFPIANQILFTDSPSNPTVETGDSEG